MDLRQLTQLLVPVFLVGTMTQPLNAQRVELSPFVTYQFGGSLAVREGELQLDDSENYGVALDIEVRPGVKFELFYSYQPTTLKLQRSAGPTEELFAIGVHYMHFGGLYEAVRNQRVRAFGLASAGVTLFDPRTATAGSEWRSSFRFALGAKALFSERVGLRGEAGLLLPIQFVGGGIFCRGGGCSGVLTGGRVVVQGSLGGALTVAF